MVKIEFVRSLPMIKNFQVQVLKRSLESYEYELCPSFLFRNQPTNCQLFVDEGIAIRGGRNTCFLKSYINYVCYMK